MKKYKKGMNAVKKCVLICFLVVSLVLSLCACGKPLTKEEELERNIELAKNCIGGDLPTLYKYIGEPERTYYGTSCLGDGLDGELHYDGFVVYTYKTELTETVRNVQKR